MAGPRVEIGVSAKPEGFARLRDEAGRLNESARRGMRDLATGASDSERRMSQLGRSMEKVARVLETIEQRMRKVERASAGATQKQGAFVQGLAQGAGFAQYTQRGPGMGRQLIGTQVGRAVAAPGRIAAGAFGGMGALQGALRNTPIAGLLASPLAAAMGYAQQAVQLQGARLAAAPMLGGMGLAGALGRAGGVGMSNAEIERRAMEARSTAALQSGAGATGGAAGTLGQAIMERNLAGAAEGPGGHVARTIRRGLALRQAGGSGEMGRRSEIRAMAEIGDAAAAAERGSLTKDRGQQRAQAQRDATSAAYGGIRRAGVDMAGISEAQALQFAGGLAQGAGGAVANRDLRTALAAQTVMGVGANVSGQFLRAGRRGGMAGGGGMAGLAGAATDAAGLRLGAAETTEYLSQIASGIQAFTQTGMPINSGSIAGIGHIVGQVGITGVRAARIGGAVQAAGQRIAQGGPQDAVDLMMLQAVGYKGGGMDDLFAAQLKLEEGMSPAAMAKVVTGLARRGRSDVGGAQILKRFYAEKLGVGIGGAEALEMAGRARAGDFSEEDIKRQEQRRKNLPEVTQAGLRDKAEREVTAIAPGMKLLAQRMNKQTAIGSKMVVAMDRLEGTMQSLAGAAANISADTITNLVTHTGDIAWGLEMLTKEGVTLEGIVQALKALSGEGAK